MTMLRMFHDSIKAWINAGGNISGPVFVDNGAKQGDVPGPVLFSLYFEMDFRKAFENFH